MMRGRFKAGYSDAFQLVMCPKPDANGHTTCPGTFGLMHIDRSSPRPAWTMRVYGIFRPDAEGVYKANRNRLRRRYVRHDEDRMPEDGPRWLTHRDYGEQGEHAGTSINDFPIVAECPRCGERVEIFPPEGLPWR